MNHLQTLINVMKSTGVHTIESSDKPYTLFKVQDLGKFFSISNPSECFKHIAKLHGTQNHIHYIVSSHRGRSAMYIAEPLLYSYLLSPYNKCPTTKDVKDWVFSSVLVKLNQYSTYANVGEEK